MKNALQYFKMVISTNKLEMLAGNGSIVLEHVAQLHVALQSYALNEYNSALISATTQVYDALGKLIKLCDEVILSDDEEKCAALSRENVDAVVRMVETAVQQLADLANEKLAEQRVNGGGKIGAQKAPGTPNTLQRPVIDVSAQRTSLPDIPLTPRERDQLEQVSSTAVRPSFSSENLICDASPPPKPPLPIRYTDPPPLPPKRRPSTSASVKVMAAAAADLLLDQEQFLQCGSGGIDRNSLRSRSPEDNSSLLSASAGSLDSALNHSREEEELKQLTLDVSHDSVDAHLCSDIEHIKLHHSGSENNWDESESMQATQAATNHQRNSNESGFVSVRSSTQSMVAKHSSMSKMSTAAAISSVISKFDAITEQNSKFSSTSSIENYGSSSVISSSSTREVSSSIDQLNASLDDVFSASPVTANEKPPLPEKSRKSSVRRVSTYDNVDEADVAELRFEFL